MAEPEEPPTPATDEPELEPEPLEDLPYRPPFAKNYPHNPQLNRLLAAFLAGNYKKVFTQAPRLARSTKDPDLARAARDLYRRLQPDPLAKAMLGGSTALLLLLILWFYTHRLGH